MIKWFCDVCGKEIIHDSPLFLRLYTVPKNRDEVSLGWGNTETYVDKCCHPVCAEKLKDSILDTVLKFGKET